MILEALALTAMCYQAGDLWQPQLPDHERHPSLFYDESDKARMLERTQQPPWDAWWQDLQKHSTRTRAPLKWWLLGEEQAAQAACHDLLHNPIWREPTHGYLEPSSHRFADYVVAYDLLASWPGLSAADNQAMRGIIAAEADHYYDELATVGGGKNYGNQRTLAASALGLAALTLGEYTSSPNGPAKWLQRALSEIRRDENWWFFRPGGLFVEGVGYTQYMNVQFVPFAIAYERATGQYLFADPRLREWLVFAAYQMMGNGELIPWGTCECGMGLGYYGLLANERYGRDLAPLFRTAFSLPAQPMPHVYHEHIALALYEPEGGGDLPAATRAFPESQTAVFRDDWAGDGVAVWFAGKDGTWPVPHRYQTYSHGDAGSFVLAYDNEILAADSGYDHWQSRDYYDATFHNVLLVDGVGPQSDTPGVMSDIVVAGPVRHATVTSEVNGCAVSRTLALVRGRYAVVVDRVDAAAEHDYTWQVRSTCPPDSEGTGLDGRQLTWPGLSATGWRSLQPGRTQLTTVVPPFAALTLTSGRWRPMSSKPELVNQVALAKWRAADTTALFVLLPNLRDAPDVTWEALTGQKVRVNGPGWTDRVELDGSRLSLAPEDGAWRIDIEL